MRGKCQLSLDSNHVWQQLRERLDNGHSGLQLSRDGEFGTLSIAFKESFNRIEKRWQS